jgi:hypothetical protein
MSDSATAPRAPGINRAAFSFGYESKATRIATALPRTRAASAGATELTW